MRTSSRQGLRPRRVPKGPLLPRSKFGHSLTPPMDDILERLRDKGIAPSAQRVAIAEYVLATDEHPSADRVLAVVGERLPVLSRATVYNTLNLFVEKGLLRTVTLAAGRVVFDPNLERHHHFVDVENEEIVDIPWENLKVKGVTALSREGFEVDSFEVVLRGRRR